MSLIYTYPLKATSGFARPIVPILITNPDTKKSLILDALLDTGADSCIFPEFAATETGHNLKHADVVPDETKGVGGTQIDTWQHTFILGLLSPDYKKLVWKGRRHLIKCLDHNGIPPLLGYKDFLSYFKITFDYKGKKILIEVP